MAFDLGSLAIPIVITGEGDAIAKLGAVDTRARMVGAAAAQAGDQLSSMAPKAQRAAQAVGAVAGAASAVVPELEGLSSAALVAETSLTGALSTVPITAWVAGIGLAVGGMIALVHWMNQASEVPPPSAAWKAYLTDLPTLGAAEERYARLAKSLDDLRKEQERLIHDTPAMARTVGEQDRIKVLKQLIPQREKDVEEFYTKLESLRIESGRKTRDLLIASTADQVEATASIEKAGLAQEAEVARGAHDAGALSLTKYYAERRSIIVRETAAEVSVLRAQLAAAETTRSGENENDRLRRQQDAARIRAEITVAEIKGQTDLAQATRELAAEQKAALAQEVSYLTAVAGAQRITHAERRRAIELEAQFKQIVGDGNKTLADRAEALGKIAQMQRAGIGIGLGPSLGSVKNTLGGGLLNNAAMLKQLKDSLAGFDAEYKRQLDIEVAALAGDTHAVLAVGLGDAFASGISAGIQGAIQSGSLLGGFRALASAVVGEIATTFAKAALTLKPLLLLWAKIRDFAFSHPLVAFGAAVVLAAIASTIAHAGQGGGGSSVGSFSSSSVAATLPTQVALGPRATPIGSQGYTVQGVSSQRGPLAPPQQPLHVHVTSIGRLELDGETKITQAVLRGLRRGVTANG